MFVLGIIKEKEMERVIITLLILFLLLTGCNNLKDDEIVSTSSVDGFRAYISQESNPFEIKKALDKAIEDSDVEVADALIFEYLNYMEKLVYEGFPENTARIQNLSAYLDYNTWTINEDEIEDRELKDLYLSIKASGFKFTSIEGFIMPTIDYQFLDSYFDKVSLETKDFAEFMQLASNQPWAMDAAIVIPLRDLADRIALGEQYLRSHPYSPFREKVVEQYTFYLSGFLGGLDNTPLGDFDTNKINPNFIEAFKYFIATYPDFITTETVKQHLEALKASDYAAPYKYLEFEKRDEFTQYVYDLVDLVKAKF